MRKDEYTFEVVVTAERGNYLKFTSDAINEDIVGKPVRIIFDKSGVIPEFTEEPIIRETTIEPTVETIAEEKSTKKTTRKKASK